VEGDKETSVLRRDSLTGGVPNRGGRNGANLREISLNLRKGHSAQALELNERSGQRLTGRPSGSN